MTEGQSRSAVALCALVGMLGISCAQLEDLPHLTRADLRFDPAQSSQIFAADGTLITTLHGRENRYVLHDIKQVPKHVRRAVVAIEDERFFKHDGIDFKAIIRAALANVTSGRIEEGGSTITQQYVKYVIISPGQTPEQTFERKITEAVLARQLEEKLSKREILRRYLNSVYFGAGAYGIQAAANTYFNVPARALNLSQGALLAGLIRSPETYDPFDNPRVARGRRDVVLRKMMELEWAEANKALRAQRRGLRLHPAKVRKRYPAPYFVDYVQRLISYDPRFKSLGKSVGQRQNALFAGGLRIDTTVDLEEQAAAERAVRSVLAFERDPYGSLVSIDPRTGRVKAMVGGRNFFANRKQDRYAKINLAVQGEPGLGRVQNAKGKVVGNLAPGTGRQAGSSFKPFALAAAIERGIPLSKVYRADACMTFPGADNGAPWTPCNYEQAPYGKMSLLDATAFSVNVVFAQLAQDVGEQVVVDTAEKMGIRTPLAPVASAVLGTNPVNPLDMASAYGTLATNGLHHPPVAITKITNAEGKVLYEDDSKKEQVLDPGSAYITTSALAQVLERGTGAAFGQIGRPAAGKTGTAQDYHDAWFVGYTPDRVASVWVGYPKGTIAMLPSCTARFSADGRELCRPTRIQVSGGTWPTAIWASFMSRALAGTPPASFAAPQENLVTLVIDTRTGCLASAYTPVDKRASATFASGTQPTRTCPVAGDAVKVPGVTGMSVEDATAKLEAAGFGVAQQTRPTNSVRPGRVVEQTPAAGAPAAEGSTVTIVVSVPGPERTTVPLALGRSGPEAVQAIQAQGLGVRVIHQAESPPGQAKKHRGRVWKQVPASGTRVDEGSTITIYVNPE